MAKNQIMLTFEKKPSALYSLWKIFRSRKSRFTGIDHVPEIRTSLAGARVDPRHLESFNEICGIDQGRYLNILYPLTLAYPFMMRILSMVPFSLFKMLNTRNVISMRRGIKPDETFDINCYNSDLRIIPKGVELAVSAGLQIDHEKVWESVTTYFIPGKFGDGDMSYVAPRLDTLGVAPVLREWHLPAKHRFRFARVSGDTNGIHYWKAYARMSGFKRDFAQPIRLVAESVASLPDIDMNKPTVLEYFLKGPVYYEKNLYIKNVQTKDSSRFDLYYSGNDKPCINGLLRFV